MNITSEIIALLKSKIAQFNNMYNLFTFSQFMITSGANHNAIISIPLAPVFKGDKGNSYHITQNGVYSRVAIGTESTKPVIGTLPFISKQDNASGKTRHDAPPEIVWEYGRGDDSRGYDNEKWTGLVIWTFISILLPSDYIKLDKPFYRLIYQYQFIHK